MTTNPITNAQKARNYINSHEDEIRAMLPNHIEQERFMRNMGRQLVGNNSLQDCDPSSLVTSCVEAANLGLDIGTLGSCHVIPYGRKATLVIGYQGLIDLAIRSGTVRAIHCNVVRKNDEYGANQTSFFHNYDPFAPESERDEIVGVYTVIELVNGASQYETMSVEQVEQVRQGSAGRNSGPWTDHWDRMAIKTVIRRALTKIKLSPEVSEQIHELLVREDTGKPNPKFALNGTKEDYEISEEEQEKVQAVVDGAQAMVATNAEQVKKAPKTPRRDWAKDLELANAIADDMGLPQWTRMSQNRKKTVMSRQREEEIDNPEKFWEHVRETFIPFDKEKIASWSSGQNLDTFLRIPQRGGVDHFLAAREGAYRGENAADEGDSGLLDDLIHGKEG